MGATSRYTTASVPTITSGGPTSGATTGGTIVVIGGTNLGGATRVTFGGVAGTITANSATSITVTTKAHALGIVDVVVTTSGGSVTVSNSYTYLGPIPTVTSLSPTSGTTNGGTNATITGTNFAAGASVTFDGTDATSIVVVSATSITVKTPSDSVGAVDVVVTNVDGQSGTKTDGYTYVAGPTISSFSPTVGPTSGGTSVTITGTNFAAGATVSFDGTRATNIVIVSTTSITATTPAHSATGAVSLFVINPDGRAAAKVYAYTYTASATPSLSSLSPTSGTTNGGTSVTLTGTNFVSGARVTFDGVAATAVTFVNSTSLKATTPAHAAGAIDVVVTNPDSQNDSLTTAYTYVSPPGITTITPNAGTTSGGTSVTITGTNFVNGATVKFDGVSATNVTVVNSTTITAKTPSDTSGPANIVVTNPDTQAATLTNGYTYAAPPSITSIAPSFGTTLGGTTVTITGANFQLGVMAVTIGGAAATNITVVSSTTITATTPAHSAGQTDLIVTNLDGQSATLAASYTYTGALTITAPPANFGYSGTLTGDALNLTSSFVVSVTDTTGANAGWRLQATIGTLTSGTNTIAPANQTITSASVTGVTGVPPSNSVAYPMTIPTTNGTIYSAAANTGTGQSTEIFLTRLAIPANAAARTYATTLTITIASGP